MLVGCSQCGPLGFFLCGLGIQPISSPPIWALDEDFDGPQKKKGLLQALLGVLIQEIYRNLPKKEKKHTENLNHTKLHFEPK
jgi:hypothetical protein